MGLIENLVALLSSWYYEEEAEPSRFSAAEPSAETSRFSSAEPSAEPSRSSSVHPSAESSRSSMASTSFPGTGVTSTSINNNIFKKKLAQKLQGYFELGKEEINKAISAEEWGLPADAISHYANAQAIFAEAMSTQVTVDSSSDSKEIKEYQGKILKWQGKVAERLKELRRRSAVESSNQKVSRPLQSRMPARSTSQPVPKSLSRPKQNISNPKPIISRRNGPGDLAASSQANQSDVKGVDPKLIELIESVIVDRSPAVRWDDVAGLAKAKQALTEMVILPTQRSDLFTGLRKPPRGLLLFGPPGNGKTMLAKAVASECTATFFSIAASSLTSKWVGEGEKLMKALFSVAVARQPSVIFIDEIDSIMSARSATEHEASRRLKSEFLIQFDGVLSNPDDRVIIMGATNRPQELDDAVLRRLVKRIYVPLPDAEVRQALLRHQLKGQAFALPGTDLEKLVNETDGYSGSDLRALCEEAAMMPIRELGSRVSTVKANQVRPLKYFDFKEAMKVIRPSVSKNKLQELECWNEEFGSK